jgi:hypothetical protein
LVLERDGGDLPDRAVEHPGGALVVVVPELHDPVADSVDAAAEAALRESLSGWGQRGLEALIEHPGAGRPAMHRAQHLDVTRVEPEATGQAVGHDVYD